MRSRTILLSNANVERATMKNKLKFLSGGLLLSIVAVSAWILFEKWDIAFKFLSQTPFIGLIIQYNFQPSDYAVPIFDIPLCAEVNNVAFSCKYTGRYEIDIVGCDVKPWENSGFGLSIDVRDGGGKSVFQTVQSNEVALVSFDNVGKRYMRFCYAVAFAPDDLPTGTRLYFSSSSFGYYEEFLQENPTARIVLRKCLDK